MSFEALIRKVEQAEQALEASERRTVQQWDQVKATWRAGWTPGRIVAAGLATGFLAGRARPLRLAGDGGLLQLLSVVSTLLASGSAQAAASEAGQAADAAGTAGPDGAVDTP